MSADGAVLADGAVPVDGADGAVLVEGTNLRKYFVRQGSASKRRQIHAVDDVSLAIAKGEILGLVGESGCGKTTLGRLLAWITEPDGGEVRFGGSGLRGLRGKARRATRRGMQMVFQDPVSSLNPRLRVGDIVGDGLEIYHLRPRSERAGRVEELLSSVGLDPEIAQRFPHECSGGQRQRVAIARALAVEPRFVVADEAVAALDASVQAQVLNLMLELRRTLGLTYLFIGHNIDVVAYMSDRIAVMYLGKIIEVLRKEDFPTEVLHPYTVALLSSVPGEALGKKRARVILAGEPGDPGAPPPGCRFHPRCPIAQPVCAEVEPPLAENGTPHAVACHFPGWKPAPPA